MRSWRHFSRLSALAAVAVTVPGAYFVYNTARNPARASAAGSTTGEEFEPGRLLYKPSNVRWDLNWDMCEKGAKKQKKENGAVDEESKEIKPTAVRHLIFVRHGQYNTDGKEDNEKELTELGRYSTTLLLCS